MVISGLDEVGETLRGYYRRRSDGKFMLDVIDYGDVEEISGLKSTIVKLRNEIKTLRGQSCETHDGRSALVAFGEMPGADAKRAAVRAGLMPRPLRNGTPNRGTG
jgi:hypothetical protein